MLDLFAFLAHYGFFATAHSKNVKTGDIPQTYTCRASCPTSCPFHKNGCYGDNHGTNFNWSRADKGMNIAALSDWVENNTEKGALIRHNVAGDMAKFGSSELNAELVRALSSVFVDRKAYTYTHCAINTESAAVIREARKNGFVINASCETFEEVDHAMALGVPAVLTVTKFYPKGTKTPAGYRLVPCPAQVREDKNCKNCELCARGERNTVICFQVHGTRAKAAANAIEEKTITFYK